MIKIGGDVWDSMKVLRTTVPFVQHESGEEREPGLWYTL